MIAELHNATLRVGSREVFANLSFMARPGQRVGIVGGHDGDSALVLQALLGMCRLSEGWACLDGEPVLHQLAAVFRPFVAWLPRDVSFGKATVDDVAHELLGANANHGMAYSADMLRRSLEQVGVDGGCVDRPFGRMDMATAQRALMGVTFMENRPVALMDSPTMWQDDDGRRIVAEYIASPRFDDVAVIVATDDMAVLDVCDKVVNLGERTEQ